MKIITLISSYRKNGNTARITNMVEEHLRQMASAAGEPLEIETLFLGHLDVQPCRGCRICFDRGEEHCPVKDAVREIKPKIDAADAVIAASPVYVDDVNGIMKNWIDRMANLCHRPGFAGKSVLLLATTGSTSGRRTLGTMKTAFSTWGFHIAAAEWFLAGALMPKAEIETSFTMRAQKAAQRLFQAVSSRQALHPSFRSLITFKIQQDFWRAYKNESYDLAYWREHGWLEPQRDFYIPHRTSPIKVSLARLAGSLIARFVL